MIRSLAAALMALAMLAVAGCSTIESLRMGVADAVAPEKVIQYRHDLEAIKADADALADRLGASGQLARTAVAEGLVALGDRINAVIALIRLLDAEDRSGLAATLRDTLDAIDQIRAALGLAMLDRFRYADLVLMPAEPVPTGAVEAGRWYRVGAQ